VRDALAAVDQHHVGRRQGLGPHDFQLLWRAVFLEDEGGLAEAADRPARLVVHGRLDEHADHFGLLDEVERRQVDLAGRRPALDVGDLDRDHGRREGIVVDPVDGVDRPLGVLPDDGAIDEELHAGKGGVVGALDPGDDADRTGRAGPAERRRDADGERRIVVAVGRPGVEPCWSDQAQHHGSRGREHRRQDRAEEPAVLVSSPRHRRNSCRRPPREG
jgi:hypothetical protein